MLFRSSFASRSHLMLAREMDLCEPMQEEGFWFWRPKGELLRRQLLDWWKEEHERQGFSLIASPASLMQEGEAGLCHSHREYFLKFNAPKIAEVAWVLNESFDEGLLGSKASSCDRAHLFFSREKLLEECISSLRFILTIPKILGFEFEIVLSVSGEGTRKAMSQGRTLLSQALESVGVDYVIEKNYRVGVLASIEIRIADSLGRRWTGPFLSVPEKELQDGQYKMLIRSAFGSLERITALLLEKKGGWLPFWLAPEQVRILVVTSNARDYAHQMLEALKVQGIRVALEDSKEVLRARIYRAVQERVPYILLLGEKEAVADVVSNILDVTGLIIVSQNNCVLLFF